MDKMMRPVVKIVEGQLRGITEKSIYGKSYAAFKGIPYGKPPVGELRFQESKPAESWSIVKDFSKFGPECPQYNRIKGKITGSDDCLYLNVYSPVDESSQTAAGKPVMVWIHGGLFATGSGDDMSFGPDYIIENDVVLVTINYRLSVFGFLNLEDGEITGNQGLKDQVLALKWVQKNIASFGGDPDNVTIFGQSAGGSSVHYLTLSPLAKGLFHKAICQSGVALNSWAGLGNSPKSYAHELASALGENIPDSKLLLQFLQSIDAHKLVEMDEKICKQIYHAGFRCFTPTIDATSQNPFLPVSPKVASQKSVDVPLMIGHTSHEAIIWFAGMVDKLSSIDKLFDQAFCPRAKKLLDDAGLTVSDLKEIYFGDKPVSMETRDNYVQMQTDVQFVSGIQEFATIQAVKNKYPVYFYKFSYDDGKSMMKLRNGLKMPGARHGDDLNFLFYSKLRASLGIPAPEPNSTEHLVMKRVTEMWTNFAKTGNPTPSVTDTLPVTWQPLKNPEDDFQGLHISDDLRMESMPDVNKKWMEKSSGSIE